MEEINLKDFFVFLKKYYVVIIMVVVLFLSIVFVYDTFIKKEKFTTYTTVVLVKDNSSVVYSGVGTIDQNDVNLNQKLISTYSQIVKSRLVLEQVIKELKLDYSYNELYKNIVVKAVDDTSILRISVTDESPNVASVIANTVAKVFEKEVSKIYNLDNISVIDDAKVPEAASNNTLFRDLVIVFVLSIALCGSLIFIVYYFDDTLRKVDELDQEIGLPVLSNIYKDSSKSELVIADKPKSATSESIRTLRTNLQFSAVDDKIKTLLVTSTIPAEGKSYISSNLAIAFAQSGKKVLLVDCDLRKGRQHKIFDVTNKKGLSNLLVEDAGNLKDYITPTRIRNLSLIYRGAFPPNPNELLSSKKMANLINDLKTKYDVVILDGAPCNNLSDSLALSSIVDRVLLVCSVDYSQKKEMIEVTKKLESFGAKIAGLAVNNVKMSKHRYGYYYYSNEKRNEND